MLSKTIFAEEIEHLKKENISFLETFGKQVGRLRKESAASLHELTRAVEEEVSQSEEEQITGFLRSVHMEVSSKLRALEEQRTRTEERVVNVLERVVASCVSEAPVSLS